MDYNRQKEARSSYELGNAMCYFSRGFKYPDQYKDGDGFKEGDVVGVSVNRAACTVKYSINGVFKVSQKNQMLADPNRVFVPYLQMSDTND